MRQKGRETIALDIPSFRARFVGCKSSFSIFQFLWYYSSSFSLNIHQIYSVCHLEQVTRKPRARKMEQEEEDFGGSQASQSQSVINPPLKKQKTKSGKKTKTVIGNIANIKKRQFG